MFTDEVSTTVLTMGLRSRRGGTWLDDRTAAGWETHLTAATCGGSSCEPPTTARCSCARTRECWKRRSSWGVERLRVHAGPAGRRRRSPCVRCLVELGATLRYHGDFDWPGITIANAMIAHGCRPWRFAAADYDEALARLAPIVGELPLLGAAPVEARGTPS